MTGFEQHREHLAPEVAGLHGAGGVDFTTSYFILVGHISALEVGAELVVQVWHIVWREQGPWSVLHHPAHEQVGNPVGSVHVMGAAAVITGIFAQLQEFLDVQVPCFQVRADRTLALAALVDRHCRVIDHFEKGHNALGYAIGALDVAAQGAHAGPVVAQAAGELRQQRIFLDGLVNAVQVVRHGGEVAAGKLRAKRSAVKQGGRAGHEIKAGEHFIEFDGAGLAVDLVQGQAHGNAHEKSLGQLNARFANVQEVTVIQGLQTQVVKLQITLRL